MNAFIYSRFRRNTDEQLPEEDSEYGEEDTSKNDGKDEVDVFVSEEEMRAIDDQIHHLSDELESLEVRLSVICLGWYFLLLLIL